MGSQQPGQALIYLVAYRNVADMGELQKSIFPDQRQKIQWQWACIAVGGTAGACAYIQGKASLSFGARLPLLLGCRVLSRRRQGEEQQ